ncbi:hypothetical protein [Phytohabitans kaempferiae]|uniref:Uncharacterized protein n=1 Tax=Phytohabitans kaempferiae TaxID=1620943 RepID=A0ABV6M880_9ACTN
MVHTRASGGDTARQDLLGLYVLGRLALAHRLRERVASRAGPAQHLKRLR